MVKVVYDSRTGLGKEGAGDDDDVREVAAFIQNKA
jgi:hypothetical protein